MAVWTITVDKSGTETIVNDGGATTDQTLTAFDDTNDIATTIELLEKAKVIARDYYADRNT